MALGHSSPPSLAVAAVGWTMVCGWTHEAAAGDEEALAPLPLVRSDDRGSHLQPPRLTREPRGSRPPGRLRQPSAAASTRAIASATIASSAPTSVT